MQHTDSQLQDLLYLRQLFCHKLGQLARERNRLLSKMTGCKMDMSHASDKLAEMTKWSDHLRENGAEEYRTYMQLSTVYYRGVWCTCHSIYRHVICMRTSSSYMHITQMDVHMYAYVLIIHAYHTCGLAYMIACTH